MESPQTIEVQRYVRRPFAVDAIQVTEENLESVAAWAGADIRTTTVNGEERRYIKVRVKRPLTERQTKAFVGDWILYSDSATGYKVYTKNAFERTFQKDQVQVTSPYPQDSPLAASSPP